MISLRYISFKWSLIKTLPITLIRPPHPINFISFTNLIKTKTILLLCRTPFQPGPYPVLTGSYPALPCPCPAHIMPNYVPTRSLDWHYPVINLSLPGPYPVINLSLPGPYPVIKLSLPGPYPVIKLSLPCPCPAHIMPNYVPTRSLDWPYPVITLSLPYSRCHGKWYKKLKQ